MVLLDVEGKFEYGFVLVCVLNVVIVKAEEADEWSYQAGLAGGWIPMNPSIRAYPNICG